MCCTIGEMEAKLSNTLIYVGESMMNEKYVHVMAYQNTARSDGPNAMVLPFPTDKPMGPDNLLNTKDYKDFLKDITNATQQIARSFSFNSDELWGGPAAAGIAQVFDSGSYTVILANHVSQIPEALKKVPEHKRPKVSFRFLSEYNKLYPKQPIAICCWDGTLEAEPLLWWYEPTDPETLFIPTMDAHDGNGPNLDAMVETDHIISVGSNIKPSGECVYYSSELEPIGLQLLPKQVHGHGVNFPLKNGDMFVKVEELRTVKHGPRIYRGLKDQEPSYTDKMYGWVL